MVTVTSGANSDPYPIAGQSVAAARRALAELSNIEAGSIATLNGRQVTDENGTFLSEDDELVFSQVLAQKG